MDITAYDQREKQLELREKLIEIEELRRAGMPETTERSAHSDYWILMMKKSPIWKPLFFIAYSFILIRSCILLSAVRLSVGTAPLS